jgi:hypothetical protein
MRRRGLRCRNVAAGKLGSHAATHWVAVGYARVRRTTNAALRTLHRRFAAEMERGSPIGKGQMLALIVAPGQYVRARMRYSRVPVGLAAAPIPRAILITDGVKEKFSRM